MPYKWKQRQISDLKAKAYAPVRLFGTFKSLMHGKGHVNNQAKSTVTATVRSGPLTIGVGALSFHVHIQNLSYRKYCWQKDKS